MARRPRTAKEEFYDVFADADVSDQIIMLQVLEGIHRQARRGKLEPKPDQANGQQPIKLQEPAQ